MKDHYLPVGGESLEAAILLEPQKNLAESGEPEGGLISHGRLREEFLLHSAQR